METKEIFFGGYKITYDMDALTEALDKIEPDERMCVYPLVLWDDGAECAITVKLDDGYDEEDGKWTRATSGHQSKFSALY